MSLFSVTDIGNKKRSINLSCAMDDSSGTSMFIGKSHQKLKDIIGEIHTGESKHYASMGDWSTHDLLFYLLQITGPAKVYFSTWAISEYAIRKLYQFIDLGIILELRGIFDYRNGIRKPAELQFLKKITTDIKAAKCHAKVTVIDNNQWGIAIVGSANFTRNPRIEAGVICASKSAADFHKTWILNELKGQSSFHGTDT